MSSSPVARSYHSVADAPPIAPLPEEPCRGGISFLRVLSWIAFPVGIVLECRGYWEKKRIQEIAALETISALETFLQSNQLKPLSLDEKKKLKIEFLKNSDPGKKAKLSITKSIRKISQDTFLFKIGHSQKKISEGGSQLGEGDYKKVQRVIRINRSSNNIHFGAYGTLHKNQNHLLVRDNETISLGEEIQFTDRLNSDYVVKPKLYSISGKDCTVDDLYEGNLTNFIIKHNDFIQYNKHNKNFDLDKIEKNFDQTMLQFYLEIAYAMRHVHENGINHNDLWPPNVFIKRNSSGHFHAKLADFGKARDRIDSPTQRKANIKDIDRFLNTFLLFTCHHIKNKPTEEAIRKIIDDYNHELKGNKPPEVIESALIRDLEQLAKL